MTSLSDADGTTRALAIGCAGLGLVFILVLFYPLRKDAFRTDRNYLLDSMPSLETLPTYSPPKLDSFSETLNRPLFYADRKLPPAPLAEQLVDAPLEPLELRLEGIAISGASRIALLRDIRNNDLIQMAAGMAHNGWVLESVDSGRVLFIRGEESAELNIESGNSASGRTPR